MEWSVGIDLVNYSRKYESMEWRVGIDLSAFFMFVFIF